MIRVRLIHPLVTTLLMMACAPSMRFPRLGSVDSASAQHPSLPGNRACFGVAATIAADTTIGALDTDSTIRPIMPSRGPHYPADLRQQHIGGQVEVSYTIDTLGAVVRGSEFIERETHKELGDAICDYVHTMRFVPLIVGQRRYSVRVLRQPFNFFLERP